MRSYVPLFECRGVQDVLLSSSPDDHRIVRRNLIQIATQRKTLFFELTFVPAGVGDDEVTRLALANPRRDRSQHIIQAARFVQINAGAVTGIMDVSVDQSRNNSLAMQIDSPGLRSDEFSSSFIALYHVLTLGGRLR
ncbi:MAG: hypothetical protein AUG08_06210 [Acidobacteria bacterium 13_1_20CM_2_55_15]|nr:MAG: hypothetical protein AUG08_06210 [Acidobacteria bacterium 13_1_20CM_2_55_15]